MKFIYQDVYGIVELWKQRKDKKKKTMEGVVGTEGFGWIRGYENRQDERERKMKNSF